MFDFKLEQNTVEFDNFVNLNKGSYLQTARWADVKDSWCSRCYSGFENGERVLTAMVLYRTMPGAGCVWYIPCGAVCDYLNTELVKEFLEFIKNESKKAKATCLIIDPLIPLRINGELQNEGIESHKLITSCGFQLNEDVDSYTYKHPVQTYIHLLDDEGKQIPADKILKNCEKGVRYSVRIGTTRGLEYKTYLYEDIEKNPQLLDEFMSVMDDTSNRNDFVQRKGDYLKHLMNIFSDCCDITMIYYNKAVDQGLENERQAKKVELLKALETAPEKKIKGIKNDIEAIDNNTKAFNVRMDETKDYPNDAKIPVAGGFTLRYSGVASCLFGGTKNIIRNNTRSSHYLNYLRICKSIETGCHIHDLGYVLVDNPEINADGTLGEMKPKENFIGINEFKMSFGAKYYEFIGEYICVNNKMKFFLYRKLMPKAKDVIRKITKIIKK